MNDVVSIDHKTYTPVGRCIYCGSKDELTDEHIIPFGLSGTALLPKSSCRECAKITGRFEGKVMRGHMQQVRVKTGMLSRSKHKEAPKTKTIEALADDGTRKPVEIGFTDGPVTLSFPLFNVPALLKPDGYTSGIRVLGINTYAFGASPEDLLKEMVAKKMTWEEKYLYVPFAQMIAKIAFASAIAQFAEAGIEPFEGEPCILSALLGKTDDIGKYVGTITAPLQRHEGQLHRVNFGLVDNEMSALATVQLFASSGTPQYGVILGTASAASKNAGAK